MNIMPETNQITHSPVASATVNESTDTRLPGAVAELRAAAVTALQSWSSIDSLEEAARLLDSWKRRPEMTDADVTAVLDAMFPEPIAEHHEAGGWKGEGPGTCGVECACGVTYDGFDSLAEAAELLARHVKKEADPAFREGYATGYLDAVQAKAAGTQPQRPDITPQVREFARRAEALGFAINPDGHPAYLVERINTLLAEGVPPFPPESEWAALPACPSWCTGRHEDDGQFRDCSSEEMFVPRYRDGVVCVDVITTFDRSQGRSTPVLVRLEDYSFNPQYARHLARLLVAAADLIEADAR